MVLTASKNRSGRREAANWRRQYVNVVEWNPAAVIDNPQAAFHRRSKVTASTVSESDNPCDAQSDHTGHHLGRHTRTSPLRRKQSASISSGNNSPPMGGPEPKHAVGLRKMHGR